MTLDKFKFSQNFVKVSTFGKQQQLNEWRQTHIVSNKIVAQ